MMDKATQDQMKFKVASEAAKFIKPDTIIGIGSGSTVNFFIDILGMLPFKIKGAVCASQESRERLTKNGIHVFEVNEVTALDYYFDGADEVTPEGYMTKGGGAALTGEKIVSELAQFFVCMVDVSKLVKKLGETFPLPVEVIPIATAQVSRYFADQYQVEARIRPNRLTDWGNNLLDVQKFVIDDPLALEAELNSVPGVVTNGIFARRKADLVLTGSADGVSSQVINPDFA